MKVLFLGFFMDGVHGSVMHIMEYANYYKELGWEVYIGAVKIDQQIKQILGSNGIHIYYINKIPLDQTYDLVYALHLLLFPALIAKGLKYKKSIIMTLSPTIPMEQIPPSQIWPQIDMFSAISQEIIDSYHTNYGLNPEIFTLIPNHIPINFIRHAQRKQVWNKTLKKICVVSNHYIPELAGLKNLAPFPVDYYGSAYNNAVLMVPQILLNYDAVITIGKTVQYCLGLGVPVYEYDHFGGCGFITLENFQEEAKTNFSGRTTRRQLNANDLLADLENSYPSAYHHARGLRNIALPTFGIDKLVAKQLAIVNAKHEPRPELDTDARLFCNSALAAMSYIPHLLAYKPN